MCIESVPNRHSPPAILLRESYREAGKVRKRTLANLSKWPPVVVEGLRILLKGGTAVADLTTAFDITRSRRLGLIDLLEEGPDTGVGTDGVQENPT